MSFNLIGLIALVCIWAGCTKEKPLTAQSLTGTYVAKYSHGTETLILRPDGTFTQRYVSPSQKEPVLNEGKWTFDSIRGADYLTLDNALRFDTGRDAPRIPPDRTMWSLPVVRWAGRIQLLIDSDGALSYEKQ